MHPYLPFAALPIAAIAAWYGASEWSASSRGRYQVPQVVQIEDPSALMRSRPESTNEPDIRIQAFLPHVPPTPPAPDATLILQSVMTGKGIRLATINGQILKEGDRVENYLVRRIADDGVELELGETTRRLPMRPLHELPPPVRPGEDPMQKKVTAQQSEADLTEDFWKIFDSLKP